MTAIEKLLQQILGARADRNFRFDDLCRVLRSLDFVERTTGSHHIFSKSGVDEIVNIQPLPGGKAKAYQVSRFGRS